MSTPPAVSVRRVHAEPADEPDASAAIDAIAWLALWDSGAVTRHGNARALVRAVLRRDRRDAARADQRGCCAIVATVITWHNPPPGFVPPTAKQA